MACSSPLILRKEDLRQSFKKNHSDFELNALRRSFNSQDYYLIPCRYCLNCRVDRQNEMIDRCEYEYINYGCGAFVTFTYDDAHNAKNGFIDSHTGEYIYSINKKDGKDFLNRLNKLVHQENKKNPNNPLCRKDYKYVITHEYGDKFNRNHVHCLFFGLDFAYCERLFWRAWQFQGAIEVGAIKNGGIAYVVKYIDSQSYGIENFFKYQYHHQTPPCSSHSLGLGEGLYKGQLKYIKEHNNCYRWHGVDRPVPTYYKNKFKLIDDFNAEKYRKRYEAKCDNIYSLYEYRIKSYKDFQSFNVDLARTKQKALEIKLRQSGKQVLDRRFLMRQQNDLIYKDNHRLPIDYDKTLCRVVDINGHAQIKFGKEVYDKLTNRICFMHKTDYNKLCKIFGIRKTDEMFGLEPVPF